jgi:hypothetical protein
MAFLTRVVNSCTTLHHRKLLSDEGITNEATEGAGLIGKFTQVSVSMIDTGIGTIKS